MTRARKGLLFLAFSVAAASCAHSVHFISIPAGAKVTLDGKPIGPAPALHVERSSPPGFSHVIRAELAGYPPIIVKDSRSLCTSTPNLLLDSIVVGLFFGFCMKDEYILDFTELMPPVPAAKPTPIPLDEPSPTPSPSPKP